MKQKKISYLISFKDEDQREEFKKLLGVVRYKSNLEVTEAMIEALRSYEKGLK
jgi:chromosome segregation ATPase